MIVKIIAVILMGVQLFFGFGSMVPIIKENKRNYNEINYFFIRLIIFNVLLTAVVFLTKLIYEEVTGLDFPVLGKNLKPSYAMSSVMIGLILLFMLYTLGFRRHYGLPIVWIIFTFLYMIQVGSDEHNTLAVAMLSLILFMTLVFVLKGIKNKSGKLFGMGIYVLINAIGGAAWYLLEDDKELSMIISQISFALGYFILFLAAWDVFDKTIFYDRQAEKAIKNNWISKVMFVEKNKKHEPSTSKKLVLECPVCKKQSVEEIMPDMLRERANNSKGIVEIPIEAGITCEHAFSVYVDRNFGIIGFKKIEIIS
ncbi:MAG: hypothetical protein ACTSUE_18355 [Promethearchaeota archaeon]